MTTLARRYPMLAVGRDNPVLMMTQFPADRNLIIIDTPQWVCDTINDAAGKIVINEALIAAFESMVYVSGTEPADIRRPDRVLDRRLHQRDEMARQWNRDRNAALESGLRLSTGNQKRLGHCKLLPHLDTAWTLNFVTTEFTELRAHVLKHDNYPEPSEGWPQRRTILLLEYLQLLHWHLAAEQLIAEGRDDQHGYRKVGTWPTACQPSTRCLFCGRPLANHLSRKHRAGPDCIRQWSNTAGLGYSEPRTVDVHQHIIHLETVLAWSTEEVVDKRRLMAGSDDIEHLPLGNLLSYANQLWWAKNSYLKT